MTPTPEILAVIFDLDDTLVPDSTTKLLQQFGFDTDRFWNEDVRALVSQGYDPTLAWLNLVLDNVGQGRPLGLLSNTSLREFGATLDPDFFPGLPEMFDRLRATVGRYRDIAIEFYIVSSGLREVILGSHLVSAHFTEAYGCEFGEDEHGVIHPLEEVRHIH